MKITRNALFAVASLAAALCAGAAAANQHAFEYHASVEFGTGTAHSNAKRGCEAAKRKTLMNAAKYGDRWCAALGLGADIDDIAHRSCRYAYRIRNARHAGAIVLDQSAAGAPFSRGEATAISRISCRQ